MANDIRLHADAHAGELDTAVGNNAGGTDTTLSSPQFASLPVVDANHHLPITTATVDATTGEVTAYEVHWITAHTAAATTVTVLRGREGSTAQAWAANVRWWHAPTALDFTQRLTQKGTWVSTAHYAPNDVVQRSGVSYIALVETTNEDPAAVAASWTPVGADHTLFTGAAAPPNAAPALNATNSGGGYSGVTTVPVPIPSTVKVDDIIVIVFAYGYWQAPTAPAGWNQILAAQASSPYNAATGVWWKKAVAGDIGASVNISSGSPTHVSWVVASYADTDGTGPQHVTATGASQTFAVLTGLPANSRVVYMAGGAIIGAGSTPAVSTIGSDVATFSGTGGGDASEAVIGSEVIAAGGSNPARTASLPNIAASDSAVVTFSLNPNPAAVAKDGDTFLDKTHRRFYGQMAGGVWGTSTGLRHNDPVAKTAAYTAVDGDVILASAATAAFNVTLPAAAIGAKIVVKKTDSSANGVTVLPTAGTIDGGANYLLSVQNATAVFISDGTNWFTHIDTMRAPRPASTLNGLPVKWNNTTGVFEDATALINKLYTGSGAPAPATPQPRTAAASVANATSINVTVPATAQVGDICLIGVTSRNTTGYACTTAGWTELAHPAGLTFSARLYWKKLVAGEPGSNVNFTIGSTSGNPVQIVAVYSDTDGNGPVASSNASGSTFPVLTGLPINCRVVYFAFGDAPGGAPGNPSISGLSAEATGHGGVSNGEEGVVTSESLAAGGSSPAHTASFVNDATASQQAVFTLAFAHDPAATAQNGDTFLDKANRRFYGQMSAGAWGAATPLRHNDPVAKTAVYTAVDGDIVLADATTAAFTVTLPVPVAGAKVVVKKTDASANAVTVGQHATETIDGATTKAITVQWDKLTVVSDGTNWFIV